MRVGQLGNEGPLEIQGAFLTAPTQKFLSIRKKQSIRTVPTQKFLSTRKKQSIRTVPTQKCLKCGKGHGWIF